MPCNDNQDALTGVERGPILLQDYQLIEKLAHQNRERIPERVVHAKGWGAHGTFAVTHDISRYTRAKCLQPGSECEVMTRFSTVAGELGAADAERDVRGFAVSVRYGTTDDFGFKAQENPVHVHDLHATMLHQLGLDHKRLTYRYSGRDFRLTDVEGEVRHALLA